MRRAGLRTRASDVSAATATARESAASNCSMGQHGDPSMLATSYVRSVRHTGGRSSEDRRIPDDERGRALIDPNASSRPSAMGRVPSAGSPRACCVELTAPRRAERWSACVSGVPAATTWTGRGSTTHSTRGWGRMGSTSLTSSPLGVDRADEQIGDARRQQLAPSPVRSRFLRWSWIATPATSSRRPSTARRFACSSTSRSSRFVSSG